ncbi:hypothetical protein TKK_0003067 [Trichogramma kaykai]
MSLSEIEFNGDPELFEKLKDIINKINWNIEEERCNFLVEFFLMLSQGDGTDYPFPNVQHYTTEIERFFLINDELNQLVHIDARDNLGDTPLHLALKEGWAKVVEVLLRRGASLNLVNDKGHTPLHVICARDQFHANYLAEFFFKISDELNQRVQIDARDKLGRTPLQLAMINLGPYTVETLLNRGVDLSNFVLRNSSQLDERFKSGLYTDIRYKLG